MTGNGYFLVSLAIGLSMVAGACEKKEMDRSEKQKVESAGPQGQSESAYSGLVEFIRKQKLVNYPSATIGNAFDSYSYLTKKEWKEASMQKGRFAVYFTGWFEPATLNDNDNKKKIAGKGIDVTFIIEPNGSYYVILVSMLDSMPDGKIYRSQSLDIAGTLDKIYANKKITL